MSLIPPGLLLACLMLIITYDLSTIIVFGSVTGIRWWSAITYASLIALSFIRYRTVVERLQIEVDGFIIKSGARRLESKALTSATDSENVGADANVSLPQWPPVETLGWTPFKSIPFNKMRPKSAAHFWAKANAASFQVRSVGYKQTKLKQASNYPLYECLGVDVVKSNKLISGLCINSAVIKRILNGESSGDIPWPWLKHKGCQWKSSFGIPRLLIVNSQLPYSSPSLWAPQSPDSDPGFSIISYYAINPALVVELNSGKIEPPAVKLLRRLMAEGQSRKEGTALKAIGVVDNMEEIGFPDIVSGYNGKPVLVTKSASFSYWPSLPECEVLEIEYDVRQWSILARKTLHSLRDKFKDAKCQLGLVIEGQNDEELPEQLLSCFRIDFLDIMEASPIEIYPRLFFRLYCSPTFQKGLNFSLNYNRDLSCILCCEYPF